MSGSQQLLLAAVQQAVATDPNFEYTTLLLPGNGTNGAQNNTFLDSSTNAFSITRNGNTTQGTFSPFSQTGWGNYFDGSGDYLETPSDAAFTLGSSGDFTVECWVYATATPGNYAAFMTTWSDANTGYSNRWFIGVHDSKIKWYNDAGGSAIADSSNIQLNTWLHVAVARSGSTITLYINGTAIGTQTTSQSYTTQGTVKLGYSGTGGNYFSGYISNARVVKGTAVYTANFTPPTAPLTAITNTSLLTCQSNRFVDNSSNAFAITRNGDVSVQAFSPFNPTAAWSAATYGGSGYFDGSGDYLVTPSNANLSSTLLGSDFTIECWLYLTSYPSGGAPIWTNSVSNSDGFSSAYVTSTGTIGTGKVGTNEFATTATVVLNAWNHFATVRNGATVYTYLNGAQAASGAASTYLNTSATKPIQIAQSNQSSPANLTGYISGYRISTAAQYTGSTYTIPTAPPTAISGTNLLLNFTNAGIYDATSKNDLETVGNAQISTTQSKFGGSSMYFDGTGDYLVAPSQAITSMEGDFTVEFWAYRVAGNNFFYTTGDDSLSSGISIYIGNSGNNLRVYSANGVVIDAALSGVSFPATTWTHIALVRSSGVVKLYVAGAQGGSNWSSTTTFSGKVYVGAEFNSGSAAGTCNGYIQDFRITKGIARYTAAFTPPTAAFPLL
jgi:hypothetical protein